MLFPQIQTILLATLPINELRGTIPIAISSLGLTPIEAFLYAVIGNMLPIFFIVWFLPTLANFLSQRSKVFNKFFNWLFERTRRKFYHKYQKYGDWGLVIFVAIPLPMTGAWSGAIAAFLFGIPYWKSLGLIFTGVIIAGIVVTLLSTGIFSLFGVI